MNSRPDDVAEATAARILDLAERRVQRRGYNGFSYADIAGEVGISKASLHYHFATQAELGVTLIVRYSEAFAAALQRISATPADAARRLRAYVKLYADVLADQRMCLCGMVAAEYATLPAPMQTALRAFFEVNEGWVAQQLELGLRTGTLVLRVPARDAARMLVARAWGDPARFAAAAAPLLAQLAVRGADGRVVRRPRSRAAGARAQSARVPVART